MKKKIIKALMILAACGVSLGCYGCSQNKSKPTVYWRPVINSADQTVMEPTVSQWQEGINQVLTEDGQDYLVQIEPVWSSCYEDDFELISQQLADLKEENVSTDVLTIIQDINNSKTLERTADTFVSCVQEGLLLPLDSVLEDYGEEYDFEIFPENIQSGTVDSQLYGLKMQMPEIFAMAYSKDQMEAYGIEEEDISSSLFENEDVFRTAYEKSGQAPLIINSSINGFRYGNYQDVYTDSVVFKEGEGFVSVVDFPECVSNIQTLKQWKEDNLVTNLYGRHYVGDPSWFCFPLWMIGLQNYSLEPYTISLTFDEGRADLSLDESASEWYIVPDLNLSSCFLESGSAMTGIASWTEQEDLAAEFLMELMTNERIATLIQYGVEGTDYQTDENGKVVPASEPEIHARNLTSEMYCNNLITPATQLMPDDKYEVVSAVYDAVNAENVSGFRFDLEPVRDQVLRTNQIIDLADPGIQTPAIQLHSLTYEDVDETIEALSKQLQEAGIQEIIDEGNRQYEQWQQENGINPDSDS